jgi:hypothetical protein
MDHGVWQNAHRDRSVWDSLSIVFCILGVRYQNPNPTLMIINLYPITRRFHLLCYGDSSQDVEVSLKPGEFLIFNGNVVTALIPALFPCPSFLLTPDLAVAPWRGQQAVLR